MYFPIGASINAAAIVVGSSVGILAGCHISERVKTSAYHALGFAIIFMGLKIALGFENVFLLTISLVLGGVTGSLLKLESLLESFGNFTKHKLSSSNAKTENANNDFSKAFIDATTTFCVGAMAVLGSIEEGTSGVYSMLLVKSFMDGIISLNMASARGKGVILAALPVLLYEGTLTFLAVFMAPWLTGGVLVEFKAVGGVLVAGVGASFFFPDKFRMLNFLPAFVWVCVLYPLCKNMSSLF